MSASLRSLKNLRRLGFVLLLFITLGAAETKDYLDLDFLVEAEKISSETGRPNALIHYEKAVRVREFASMFKDYRFASEDLLRTTLAQGWSPSSRPLLEVFKKCSPSFDLAREGAALATSEYPDPEQYWPLPPEPSHTKFFTLAKLLCAAGLYNEANERYPKALDNYLVVIAMGDHVVGKNAGLSGAVYHRMIPGDGVRALSNLARRDALDRAALNKAIGRLKATSPAASVLINVEQSRHRDQLSKLEHIQAMFAEDTSPVFAGLVYGPGKIWHGRLNEAVISYYKTPHWLANHQGFEVCMKKIHDEQPKMHFYPDMSYASTALGIRKGEAEASLALQAIALALYKLDHGAYPESLDRLTPDILAALPIDPFSGKPFGYRLDGKDYLLFSVGSDGVSQDGKELHDPMNGQFSAGDIFFAPRP